MPKMLSHCFYLRSHAQAYQHNVTAETKTAKATATTTTTMLFVMKPEQRNYNVCI